MVYSSIWWTFCVVYKWSTNYGFGVFRNFLVDSLDSRASITLGRAAFTVGKSFTVWHHLHLRLSSMKDKVNLRKAHEWNGVKLDCPLWLEQCSTWPLTLIVNPFYFWKEACLHSASRIKSDAHNHNILPIFELRNRNNMAHWRKTSHSSNVCNLHCQVHWLTRTCGPSLGLQWNWPSQPGTYIPEKYR